MNAGVWHGTGTRLGQRIRQLSARRCFISKSRNDGWCYVKKLQKNVSTAFGDFLGFSCLGEEGRTQNFSSHNTVGKTRTALPVL